MLIPSLLLLCAATAQADGAAAGVPIKGPGGIVALVGDEVITQAELERELDRHRAHLEARFPAMARSPRLARMVLDKMVGDNLLLQEVRKEEKKVEGAYITEEDLDAEVARQAEAFKKRGANIRGADDLYEQWRKEDGISRDEARKKIRQKLSINKYLWQRVWRLNNELVSPQELKVYYRAHLKDFSTPVGVAFRQIVIIASRSERAEQLIQLVEAGLKEQKEFCDLARLVADAQGQDPELACQLYETDFEALKSWVAPVAETLLLLGKGETRGPVLTTRDIRFFRVEDVREGSPRPFSEVQEELTRRIREEENQRSLDAHLALLRRKTRIEVFLPEAPREKAAPVEPGSGPAAPAAGAAAAKEGGRTEKPAGEVGKASTDPAGK
jgi:hypothetical protein